jgi:hypothetical protein
MTPTIKELKAVLRHVGARAPLFSADETEEIAARVDAGARQFTEANSIEIDGTRHFVEHIAADLGCSISTVRHRLATGVPLSRGRYRRADTPTYDVGDGVQRSISEIAREYALPRSTVDARIEAGARGPEIVRSTRRARS